MVPQRYQIHAHRGFVPSVPTMGRECSRKNASNLVKRPDSTYF